MKSSLFSRHHRHRPLFLAACLLTACPAAPPPERPPPTSSRPVATTATDPQSVQVVLGEQEAPTISVVPTADLVAAFPDLAALSPEPQRLAVGALHLVPAPCLPCWEERQSLARCAVTRPIGCENLPALVGRAARLAAEGAELETLRDALSYADVWFPTPPHRRDPLAVDIEVWVDPTSPFVELTLSRVAEVEARTPGPLRWRWHALPPPSSARSGGAAVDPVTSAFARAIAQEKGRAWLEALQGVDAEAIQSADRLAGVSAAGPPGDLEREVEERRTKDVRSSPTWFVEGYRLRGLQSAQEIHRVIVLEQTPSPPLPLPGQESRP